MRSEDELSRLLCELSALALTALRFPQPSAAASQSPPAPVRHARRPQVSPAGLAFLLLGASMALVLCGSVTFMIGFILMPWIIGIVMVFYFVGFLSSLSGVGRAVVCPDSSSAAGTSPKEILGSTLFQTSDYLDMKWQLVTE